MAQLKSFQYPRVCLRLPQWRLFVLLLPLPPPSHKLAPGLLIDLPFHLISAPFRSFPDSPSTQYSTVLLPWGDQKHPVQTVIIAGLPRASDLVL